MDAKGANNISVIILAGGFGTRMKSKLPKVMHKICGKPMLFCIIDEVQKISDDIHIVLYNQATFIEESLNQAYPLHNFRFHIQDYENYPGTAGALMQGGNDKEAKKIFAFKYDRALILSGDMPLVRKETLEEFIKIPSQIVLGVLSLENASGYGRVITQKDSTGQIVVKKIIEEKDADEETKKINLANAGVYCIQKEVLDRFLSDANNNNQQKEFYLTDIVDYCSDIKAVVANIDDFMGVNSKLDLSLAEEVMLTRLRNKAMKDGVIMRLPQSIYIEFDVNFKGECEIESGAVLKGVSTITNSKILAHSVIEESIITNSTIGPFGRIRPKSHIVDSHIGNFVEVKASTLCGVKAGHLSYIGDSEIEKGTNIGAGVITCNYDGKNKHKTIIGKNVFVGSGTQLVAPLRIESDVLIGAGSVITKNVKSGDLVIARAKQTNIKDFFYKFFEKKS